MRISEYARILGLCQQCHSAQLLMGHGWDEPIPGIWNLVLADEYPGKNQGRGREGGKAPLFNSILVFVPCILSKNRISAITETIPSDRIDENSFLNWLNRK